MTPYKTVNVTLALECPSGYAMVKPPMRRYGTHRDTKHSIYHSFQKINPKELKE
jgi:hypothetical protein